jgi:hypothetical protein
MNTRRQNVAWDETLVRVEYLDDKGEPYFCEFEKRDCRNGQEGRSGDQQLSGRVGQPIRLVEAAAPATLVAVSL